MTRKLFLLISLIIFSYYTFQGINYPYVGPNATNFSVYSLIAHNYNKFGYLQTRLGSVISVSDKLPDKPSYFQHHPPLLSVTESFLFRIFGEGFWVGRLTVILFSLGTFLLVYLIANLLMGEKYGLISVLTASLIPASSIFGKLIGQEPLVLFFILLTTYLSLKFLKTGNRKYLVFSSIAVVLGTLSDWPMLYFSLSLLLLFKRYKKMKAGFFLAAISIATAVILVIYISWIMSGLWDLQFAVNHRTFTGLKDIALWPFYFAGAIIARLSIYYNPLVVIMSGIYLYTITKTIKKKRRDVDLLILIFFLFALLHILSYAQASFTHPYLIHYFLPFFVFSSSLIFLKLHEKKRYLLISLATVFSILYLITIQNYKIKQIEANLWKYDLTKKIAQNLTKYETVVVNADSAIDADMLWYPFLINILVSTNNNPSQLLKNNTHYIYSCLNSCWIENPELKFLLKNYQFKKIDSPETEVFLFNTKLPQKEKVNLKVTNKAAKVYKEKDTLFIRNLYRYIKDLLKVPQI
ncbi:MAG: glycosyltransferase family 39 protein [Actinobacteria bacterium]|nr:glycosyltransferase family 39 protein [Actinomycetota bacterium]